MPTVGLRSVSGGNTPVNGHSTADSDQCLLVTSGYCRTRPKAVLRSVLGSMPGN